MKLLFNLLVVCVILNGCRPEPYKTPCENPNIKVLTNKKYKKDEDAYQKYLILNEGTYTYGNASITSFSPNQTVHQNVFKEINNFKIGDVLQSAYTYKDEIYLIVNNSQKIEVVDKNDLQRKRTLVGFNSPRYMTTINNYGFVTDLYANKISVIDMFFDCEYASINMKGWTEQIFNIDDRLFVIERSEVGAVNLFANIVEIEVEFDNSQPKYHIIKRTSITIEPQSVVKDYENNIWILSSGKESEHIYPTLTKFNTSTNSIEKSFSYNSYANIPQNITANSDKNSSYLHYNIGTDIYKLSKDSSSFPLEKSFTTIAQNIYNLSYNDNIGEFYVLDAKDYISEGLVYIYTIDGNLQKSITAGIIPSKVVF